MNDWNVDRVNLFSAEIIKLYLAFNKPIVKSVIGTKAELMNETLHSLRTDKIQEFFS